MTELYDFQKQAVEDLQHPEKHIVVAGVGTGKGAIMLHWLRSTQKRKWLVVTTASKRDSHDIENEAVMWFGEEYVRSLSSFTVISWQALAKWTIANWNSLEDYAFAFDECLPYDTLVETEVGLRQLGALAVGEKVWSYNEQTKERELKTITRIIKRPAQAKMYKIKAGQHEIISTANHPHYTERGWVDAKDIKNGDTIYVTTKEARDYAQREEIRKICELSLLPATNPDSGLDIKTDTEYGRHRQDILQQDMCKSQPKSEVKHTSTAAESYAQPKIETQSSTNQASQWRPANLDKKPPTQGWKRQVHPASTAVMEETLRTESELDTRVCSRYQEGGGVSTQLQSGYRKSYSQVSNRSGWGESQKPQSQSTRPKENSEIRGIRVESIEVLELRDIKRCGLYRNPHNVYCIDVEGNHNFFANGILTHNCQKFKHGISSARGRAVLQITKRTDVWTGYTGTPGNRWIEFQAYFIAAGFIRNKSQFMREFCQVQTFKGYPEIVAYHHEDTLRKWWAEMTVCPDTSAMANELPPERHYTIHFDPDKAYKDFKKTHTTADGTFLDTTGAVCAEERRLAFNKKKQQWLSDFVENLGTNCVVFYALNETGDQAQAIIEKVLPEGAKVWRIKGGVHQIPREDTIGKYDVVLCQWEAGSEALNLQFINEWVSIQPWYTYGTSEQARGRIKRYGQAHDKMEFYYLWTRHTIEDGIYKALKQGSDFAEDNWIIEEEP